MTSAEVAAGSPPARSWRADAARALTTVIVAIAVFVITWFFRFNDPGGAFAGLTDDHFYYLVRGWQILFGELPVRDFADNGAPLQYYTAWAVQTVFGRGTLSEAAFSISAIALGAAATFALARHASGSIVCGLIGAAFEILLEPRLYGYPKILVYVAAIAVLWAFADRPTPRRASLVALVAVVGFMFRHDHGAYVSMAMAVTLVLIPALSWRERLRQALWYAGMVLVLLAPYLLFVQANGGVVSYFRETSAWAERDRARASVTWPALFEQSDPETDETRRGNAVTRAKRSIRANAVAWTYDVELALPLVAAGMLWVSRDGFRRSWPNARVKIGMVAALGLVLDAGFLRSPLAARLADPSVPHAILIAWLTAAAASLVWSSSSLRAPFDRRATLVRGVALAALLPIGFVIWSVMGKDLHRRFEKSAMTQGLGDVLDRRDVVIAQMRAGWDIASWPASAHHSDLIGLSRYVNACTAPGDRVFVDAYAPQIVAMARRGFAGGHSDLRFGMFDTADAQRRTVARLRRQSVPVILLDADDAFPADFPVVMAYIAERYRLAGTRRFGDRIAMRLYVRRDLPARGTYEPFGWPCYGSGVADGS